MFGKTTKTNGAARSGAEHLPYQCGVCGARFGIHKALIDHRDGCKDTRSGQFVGKEVKRK